MSDSLIQIPIEAGNEAFFDAAARGELRIQACTSCDRLRFPPRPICPWCRSTASTWRKVSGRGRIWSFAVPHPPLLPPFAERAPYNVVVVELEDDPLIRLVGNVVDDGGDGLSFVDPGDLRIGASVRVSFPDVPGEPRLPRWILVS
jgi:uncharacterized protein